MSVGDRHHHGSGRPAVAGGRKPAWLKVRVPPPGRYRATGALLDDLALHSVCREARCPNKGECFASGTATFLILGDVCTRECGFCSVRHAEELDERPTGALCGPAAVDEDEPRRVATAAARLGLRHVVVTSVTRDDLPDGGAGQFAATIEALRDELPQGSVEVLIPDLRGDQRSLARLLAARPDVVNHNLETVPRLYADVRPQAGYQGSLELLRRVAGWADATAASSRKPAAPGRRPLVKSGLMVGLGERADEVDAVLADCTEAGVDLVTIGQYLQPRRLCLPVTRYVKPAEFARYERHGADLGLRVTAGPFVRSSYRAGELLVERGAVDRTAGG